MNTITLSINDTTHTFDMDAFKQRLQYILQQNLIKVPLTSMELSTKRVKHGNEFRCKVKNKSLVFSTAFDWSGSTDVHSLIMEPSECPKAKWNLKKVPPISFRQLDTYFSPNGK
jgi:hypothetical protein